MVALGFLDIEANLLDALCDVEIEHLPGRPPCWPSTGPKSRGTGTRDDAVSGCRRSSSRRCPVPTRVTRLRSCNRFGPSMLTPTLTWCSAKNSHHASSINVPFVWKECATVSSAGFSSLDRAKGVAVEARSALPTVRRRAIRPIDNPATHPDANTCEKRFDEGFLRNNRPRTARRQDSSTGNRYCRTGWAEGPAALCSARGGSPLTFARSSSPVAPPIGPIVPVAPIVPVRPSPPPQGRYQPPLRHQFPQASWRLASAGFVAP